jgi:cbb3-type cytochrome oxidase subunit 3
MKITVELLLVIIIIGLATVWLLFRTHPDMFLLIIVIGVSYHFYNKHHKGPKPPNNIRSIR